MENQMPGPAEIQALVGKWVWAETLVRVRAQMPVLSGVQVPARKPVWVRMSVRVRAWAQMLVSVQDPEFHTEVQASALPASVPAVGGPDPVFPDQSPVPRMKRCSGCKALRIFFLPISFPPF